jgi:hypothetical protein
MYDNRCKILEFLLWQYLHVQPDFGDEVICKLPEVAAVLSVCFRKLEIL